MVTRSTRKTGISEGWTVKSKNENGTVTWVNGEFEEITLHESTVPNETTLQILAANGIVPQVPNSTQIQLPNLDNYDPQEFPESEEEDNALSRVLSRVKSAPSDLRSEVRLHRVKPDGKLAYCAKFTVEEYDESGEELIRGTFGAGTYRVMVYGPSIQEGNNYGKFVRLANQLVEIEPSLVPLNFKSTGGDNLQQMAGIVPQMLIERINQLQSAIERNVTTPNADPMEQFERFARFQKMLGGSNQGKSLLEQIKEMEALKKFKDGMLDGDSETKTPGMMDLAAQVLEILKPKLAETAAQPALIAPNITMPPSIAAAPLQEMQSNVSQPQTESNDMNLAENLMINVMIGALVKAAQRGESIETHAPGLADKLPDEVLDILEQEIWFDALIEIAPKFSADLIQYKTWFKALRDRIIELTLEPPADPV